jgi:sulfite exporter TauE/SafE
VFEPLLQGAALGLATGTACLASCGPVYCTYLLSEKRSGLQSLWVVLTLNAGRFVAYAAFGAAMGLLGGAIPPGLRGPLASAGYLLFSAYLVLSVVRVAKSCGGCRTSKLLNMTRSPLILGLLTGFSICPAFLIALTSAFESSGPLSGMLLFIGFYAGTTVYMLPFAFLGLLTRRSWFTAVARILAIVVAAYFFAVGVRTLMRSLLPRPAAIQGLTTSGTQIQGLFTPVEADTIYVTGFDGYPGDHAAELRAFLQGRLGPEMVLVTADSTVQFPVDRIPELSAVIVPWWVDPRSGETLSGWRQAFAESLNVRRCRILAIEYEPWCADRAEAIVNFLTSYSFSVAPDSGFSFLMLNSLDCAPADCDTCPLYE